MQFINFRNVLGIDKLRPRRNQILVTSLLLCFGGGVLLATAMLHMLPEVGKSNQSWASTPKKMQLACPVACLLHYLRIQFLTHLTTCAPKNISPT